MILNAPTSFEEEIGSLGDVEVVRSIEGQATPAFLLAFVLKRTEIEELASSLETEATKDPILWFAYPKGTSKKLKCDFNRDTGWAVLKDAGFDTVRAIAIDEDWTALRFRRAEFIKARANA